MHPELLLPALALGGLAAAFGWWRPSWVLPAGTAAGVAVLVPGTRATAAVVVAAALLAAAGRHRDRTGTALGGVAVALLAVAVRHAPVGVVWSVLLVGTVALVAGRALPCRLPPPAVPALLGATAAALWLCAPDTEEVIAVGGALALPLLLVLVVPRMRAAGVPTGAAVAPLVVLAWAGSQGFRGRPGGVAAVAAILFALAAWPLADAIVALARPGAALHDRPMRARLVVPALVVVVGAQAVAARTGGLETEASAAWPPLALLGVVVLAAALGCTWWGRRAAPDGALAAGRPT